MAKGDGEKIVIRFTEPLVGDASGNEAFFDVSFQEYSFVPGGSLTTVHREVVSVGTYTALNFEMDISDGIYDKTELFGETLILEDQGR